MELPFDLGLRGQSALGLVAFVAIAWGFSEGKGRFPFFAAVWTIAAQIAIAAGLLYTPLVRDALGSLTVVVNALQAATTVGTSFVFGYLGGAEEAPFEITNRTAYFNFAFGALPLVIFFSGLSALLWHWRILKIFVRGFAFSLSASFASAARWRSPRPRTRSWGRRKRPC